MIKSFIDTAPTDREHLHIGDIDSITQSTRPPRRFLAKRLLDHLASIFREFFSRPDAFERRAGVRLSARIELAPTIETTRKARRNLIKQKELLAVLESATDRCEDAAVLIEGVLVKQG